ncbi:MAG: cobalamin transport system substrate-binding protein [Candidatus Eremiobacteraeota bacterium]|nr:cobalamin transport system substrate-binding protein [Candidatus Eremiobacteraeota bacterium]
MAAAYRGTMLSRVRALAALLALPFALAPASAAPPAAPQRVVSLVPSLTEDLFALGAGARVVGVSNYADYPPAARRLPVVASFASVDAERIVALRADLVLGITAQAGIAADLRRTGIPVRLLRDDSLDDVYANLRAVGDLTGTRARAESLVRALRARTAALARTRPARKRPPTVFVVLGTAPIFTVGQGSYIAQLLALAGARNAAADVRVPYARYSAEALLARQPDALVVDPAVGLAGVLDRAPWNALRAVREHRVYTLPDPAILERPGPRYNVGLAWLIRILRELPA